MTEQQRADLAARIADLRIRRYGGNRKAAYTDCGVNSGTWKRAEAGETLAERSLVAIVGTLWPETHGDWHRITPPLGDFGITPEVLADLGTLSPSTRSFILERLGITSVDEAPPESGVSAG